MKKLTMLSTALAASVLCATRFRCIGRLQQRLP